MKKFIPLILIGILISSCSADDANNSQIVGNWKLMEAKFYGLEGGTTSEGSIDYSNQNIIYNFQTNEILLVSGGGNAGYPTGEYEYSFGTDYLGGSNEPQILIVKINSSKWTYDFKDRKMILGKSYVDGPDLIFERK